MRVFLQESYPGELGQMSEQQIREAIRAATDASLASVLRKAGGIDFGDFAAAEELADLVDASYRPHLDRMLQKIRDVQT